MKKKQKNIKELSLKKNAEIVEYSPTESLLDENFIGKAILECLKNNDPEGVIEVIDIYLDTVNKVRLLQNVASPQSKTYRPFCGKNPTLKTLTKIVHLNTLHIIMILIFF